MNKRAFILIFIIVVAILLSSCTVDAIYADPVVESISVDGLQNYYYFEGDDLNLEGATLFAIYDNGDIEEIPLTEDMIQNFSTIESGKKEVVVLYKGVTTTFEIEIIDAEIDRVEIKDYPNKLTYIEGTNFDVSGATIDIFFLGGKIVNIPILTNMVEYYDSSILGIQNVRIKYRTESLYIPITIIAKELESISINTLPTNKGVFIGHDIDRTGMIFDFHYNNKLIEQEDASRLANLTFEFDNTIATPSTTVKAIYEPYPKKIFTVEFKTQVLSRLWKSMKILQYPVTKGILLESAVYDKDNNIVVEEKRTTPTTLQDIVQGDIIDLDTGKIEVTFNDGTIQVYSMSDNLIKVYNKNTEEKEEIEGLSLEPIEKKDTPVGDYILDYGIKKTESQYTYETEPQYKVTAKNKEGEAVPIFHGNDNDIIEIKNGQIYTITITATVYTTQEIDGINQEVRLENTKSFKIYAINAIEPRRILDISSAGNYELTIIYMENTEWSVSMAAKVCSRIPTSLELNNFSDITNHAYIVGENINISFLKYRLHYNNGDMDEWQSVERSMLSPECSLYCSEPTSEENKKRITFMRYGIVSEALNVNIIPIQLDYIELEPPTNVYVAQGADINPSGGVVTIYRNNNTKSILNLETIIGIGTDDAQIIYDETSDMNSIVNEIEPYTATLRYLGGEATFDYYVVGRLVDSLQLKRSGDEKTSYFVNEELDLSGLSLEISWKNSNIKDTIPVTNDMLYHYNPYQMGAQTILFRYRGIINNSFSINRFPRIIDNITLLQEPRTLYIAGIHKELDLVGIRIMKYYNDGSIEEQIGMSLNDTGGSYGWYYNESEIDFRTYNQLQTVVLSYKDEYNEEPLQISYDIKIRNEAVEAICVGDPNDPNSPSTLSNIATVSKGLPLRLNIINKIYVKFFNIDEYVEVPLTPTMINYEKSDITVGSRIVEISYNGATCNAIVIVKNSYLESIVIDNLPKTDYIIGENLDLTDGTVKRIFRIYNSDETWYDIMPMNVEGITVSGFNNDLQEDDYDKDEYYKEQMINIEYMNLTYNYTIKVYKKFDANISYFSTVSFYGDVSMPYAGVNQDIESFHIPRIETFFIISSDLISELPAGYEIENEYDNLGNIMHVRYKVNEQYYLKLCMDENSIKYICTDYIMTRNNYPTKPAQGNNVYYIMIQVEGNRYYNAINYAQKQFRIIKKMISVNVVVPNKNAIVWEIQTTDNARSAYLVGNYIEQKIIEDSSIDMILANLTEESFQIVITKWGNNNPEDILDEISNIITETYWSYVQYSYNDDGDPILDEFGNQVYQIYEVRQNDMPNDNAIEKEVQIINIEQYIGVNYRIFGDSNERISYYVPSGGLIAVRDEENFYIIELFSGSLFRSLGQDVIYDVNGEKINGFDIDEEQVLSAGTTINGYEVYIKQGNNDTLINNNYFINYSSQIYIIAPKEIFNLKFKDIESEQQIYAGTGELINVVVKGYDGSSQFVEASYKTSQNGEWINFDKTQIRYYYYDAISGEEIPLERGEYPTQVGVYRARIINNYKAKIGSAEIVWDCLLKIV